MDHQQNTDGSRPAFVIPAGMVFIVTGMDWVQFSTVGRNNETLFLHALVPGGVIWPSVILHANGSGEARAGGSQAVTGVIFKSGQTMCVSPNNGSMGSVVVLVHGYLARER